MLGENEYIDYFGKIYPLKNYINLIKNNSFYAGDLELGQSVFSFKINIAVYSWDINDYNYKFQIFYIINKSEGNKNPVLILNYDNIINHYTLLSNNFSNTIGPILSNNNIITNILKDNSKIILDAFIKDPIVNVRNFFQNS